MPLDAVSLFGFMDLNSGVEYLRTMCNFNAESEETLGEIWKTAKEQLGSPIPKAGKPDVLDIPIQYKPYLDEVAQHPLFAQMRLPWSFKLVEIDPILAYQYHVAIPRSEQHCSTVSASSDLDLLLNICLPSAADPPALKFNVDQNGCWMHTGLNTCLLQHGLIGEDLKQGMKIVGVLVGSRVAFAQVVSVNGRCFLRNGYHRAYGLRKSGVTHLPCVYIEAPDYALAELPGPGQGFQPNLLESKDPPTCGHMTQGRAYELQVKKAVKLIRLSLVETVLLED